MRYRKPEELKEAGIEWIGEIPEDWHLKKLKFLSEVNSSNVDKKSKEREVAVKLCNYTDVYYNEFITNEIEFMKATASDKNIDRFQLKKGDIIITKDSESQDDMAVPALVKETKENLLCGYHLALIRSSENILSGDYLFRLFQSKKYREEFGNRSNGITRYGLNVHELKNIPIHVPELSEQRAIAAFLDRKTEAIGGLIEKKEQLIERLKEKRQALITQAVTKGLDPDVPMKDSEIEWQGEIPEHWEIEKNKNLFKEIDQRSKTGKEELLSVSHKTGITKRSETDVNMFEAESNEGYKICEVNDLVINTMWAWMGALGISSLHGIVSPSYNVYRVKKPNFLPDFFDYYIKTPGFITDVNRYSKGVWKSRLRLYPDEFFKIRSPIPPVEEQRKIVNFLDSRTNKMGRVIIKLETFIEKLSEYRQSLISATVTGKIDVLNDVEVEVESREAMV